MAKSKKNSDISENRRSKNSNFRTSQTSPEGRFVLHKKRKTLFKEVKSEKGGLTLLLGNGKKLQTYHKRPPKAVKNTTHVTVDIASQNQDNILEELFAPFKTQKKSMKINTKLRDKNRGHSEKCEIHNSGGHKKKRSPLFKARQIQKIDPFKKYKFGKKNGPF